MKSYLNKYTFDVDRLFILLEDENAFYLKHLFDYFTDTPPLKSVIISQNNKSSDIIF